MSSAHRDSKAVAAAAAEAREKHRKYMLPAVANYYAESIVLEEEDGMDEDGE